MRRMRTTPERHDDAQNHSVSTRRRSLVRAGATAALALGGMARAAERIGCVVRPQQTAGPFYVDERLQHSDLRTDPATGRTSDGVPLALSFAVTRRSASSCEPLRGARVDVWQCDAQGRYSDVRGFGASTTGQRFLRGYQRCDAAGLATFTTIVPGWYPGRAVHIHFRIDAPAADGRTSTFISQLYFDDALVDRVHAHPAYARRTGRRLRNAEDGLFGDSGAQLVLAAAPAGAGYAGRFDLALE